MKDIQIPNRLFRPITIFFCLFFFQVFLNLGLKVPHSVPDECGALAYAAKLTGNDWSYIFEKSGLYYGSGTTLPFFYVFYLVKDPTILYRIMLAVGCLWRTLPVFICYKIAKEYLDITDDRTIAFMSIAAILGTPTRGSAIDNEPMLILTGWISAYLVLKIIDHKSKKALIIDCVLLAIILAYSYTAHQRSIVYFVAAVITLIIVSLIQKKSGKKVVFGVILTCIILLCLGVGAIYLLGHLATTDNNILKNTLLYSLLSISDKLSSLISLNGIRNFIILICSNLWGTYTYFCGMIELFFLIVPVVLIKGRAERTREENAIIYMSVYLVLVFIIFLIGLGIICIGGPQETLENGAEISRGYFYLRYIGSTFGICIFLIIGFLIRYGFGKRYLIISLFFALFVFRFTYSVSLKKAFENGYYNGDEFSFFGPLSFSGSSVFNNGKTAVYYVLPTVIASLVLILIYAVSKCKNKIWISVILSVIMFYQYSYMVLMRDRPYSEMYFSFADKLYEVKKEYPGFLDNVNTVYYCSKQDGLDTNTQLILMDIPLIQEFPKHIGDNIVLLTDNTGYLKKRVSFEPGQLDVYCLDENEYIYSNCDELKLYLSEYLMENEDGS